MRSLWPLTLDNWNLITDKWSKFPPGPWHLTFDRPILNQLIHESKWTFVPNCKELSHNILTITYSRGKKTCFARLQWPWPFNLRTSKSVHTWTVIIYTKFKDILSRNSWDIMFTRMGRTERRTTWKHWLSPVWRYNTILLWRDLHCTSFPSVHPVHWALVIYQQTSHNRPESWFILRLPVGPAQKDLWFSLTEWCPGPPGWTRSCCWGLLGCRGAGEIRWLTGMLLLHSWTTPFIHIL